MEAGAALNVGDMDAYNAAMAESKAWAEGGSSRIAMHIAGGALIGGLSGGSVGSVLGGAAGAGLAAPMAKELDAISKGMGSATGSELLGNIAANVAAGVGGALVGGGVGAITASNVLAGAAGALVGGGMGATTAANADLYNRQLHPQEKPLAKNIADKSSGQHTQAQVEDQMRVMGMCVNGGCVSPGGAEELNGRTLSDLGAQWTNTNAGAQPVPRNMKKRAKSRIAVLAGVLLVVGVLSMVKIHFGYYQRDKEIANAAEKIVIQRFNSRLFDAVYDNFARSARNNSSRAQAIAAMNETFDRYGSFTEDIEIATTCFPEEVRMVRWLKSSKGNDLSAMMSWYVPNGERAELVMMHISPGHASVDPEVVHAHSCSGRAYATRVSSAP